MHCCRMETQNLLALDKERVNIDERKRLTGRVVNCMAKKRKYCIIKPWGFFFMCKALNRKKVFA